MVTNRFNNNFDFLRFVGASLVIFCHTYYWLGFNYDLLTFTGTMSCGLLGVSIFFVISGYLICQSWDKNKNLTRFFWNRILRILPGLAGVSFFSILVVGPLATKLNIIEYITSPNTWAYLRTVSIYWWTPNSLPGIVQGIDGVIWTIPIEFTLYIIIGVMGVIGLLYLRKTILLFYFLLVVLYSYLLTNPANSIFSLVQLPFTTPAQGNLSNSINILGLMILFMSGSMFYIYREKIRFDNRVSLIVAAICLFSIILFNILFLNGMKYFYIVSVLAWHILLPYLILYLAFIPTKTLSKFGARGDYSYGLYLYSWPVQLVITQYIGGSLNILTGFITFFLITLFFAYLSWNIIEKRALELKNIFKIKASAGIDTTN